MATWSKQKLIVERIRITIPASQTYGAHYTDVESALAAAFAERKDWLNAGGRCTDIILKPGDDEIVVSFEVERYPTVSE